MLARIASRALSEWSLLNAVCASDRTIFHSNLIHAKLILIILVTILRRSRCRRGGFVYCHYIILSALVTREAVIVFALLTLVAHEASLFTSFRNVVAPHAHASRLELSWRALNLLNALT